MATTPRRREDFKHIFRYYNNRKTGPTCGNNTGSVYSFSPSHTRSLISPADGTLDGPRLDLSSSLSLLLLSCPADSLFVSETSPEERHLGADSAPSHSPAYPTLRGDVTHCSLAVQDTRLKLDSLFFEINSNRKQPDTSPRLKRNAKSCFCLFVLSFSVINGVMTKKKGLFNVVFGIKCNSRIPEEWTRLDQTSVGQSW